ncbi:hypothetical protein PVT71_17435 [Salipiger sp. H15]|uniref:PepSY domain-containing protein n=1 Tax=Alloyangia sp. H15 TaxID=3029062 RepID=A0AAU8AQ01_9RHOB
MTPPDAALRAKQQLSRRVLQEDGVQSVGLRRSQDGDWRVCVTLLRGAPPPPGLPRTIDGYRVETEEDDPFTPVTPS